MMGAGPNFGRLPTCLTAFGISQGCRGNERAVRCHEDLPGEGNCRIDPVAHEADIKVAAVLAHDLEPVHEILVAHTALQILEHSQPARD